MYVKKDNKIIALLLNIQRDFFILKYLFRSKDIKMKVWLYYFPIKLIY